MKSISPFQVLTQDIPEVTHEAQAQGALQGGARWVQLRVKGRTEVEVEAIAAGVLAMCIIHKAVLILNDYVDIALRVGAHGVHLGLDDMPVAKARQILGPRAIIGGTANTVKDIRMHVDQGADYVGVGPFRFTATKHNLAPVLGLEGLSALARECAGVRLIAIGGIGPADVRSIMNTGVHGIAVSSAINSAPDPQGAVEVFIKALNDAGRFNSQEND